MRVLHVYSGNLYGGIETFLVTLARFRGAAPDMVPSFALCFEERLAAELRGAGTPPHLLGEVSARKPWTITRARRRLRELVAREGIDVAVFHAAWPQALLSPALAGSGVQRAFWLHDAASGKSWVERWASRVKPDLVICNSHFTRSTLDALYRAVPSVVEYYPVQTTPVTLAPEERRALRAELGARDETVIIIQTSRFQEWKGQLRHLRAVARLPRELPWLSVQVGGPQRPSEHAYFTEVQATAERLGILDRVRFLGQRSDVPRLLAAADVHCQPNAGPEPFGIVFIEALAAGLPVVTIDMGAAREIVTPEVGFLAGDGTGLALALERLVREPELRARLGAGGPARARAMCAPEQQIPALARAVGSMVTHPAPPHGL